ncbi:hypothetical protein HGO53_06345 [Wolbachia endosymbiont of Diaphorina citri]|jgi:hypothetical protein|uniref:hypothetical protein n=1 Tax=Wolbachia endosymbiont of Diaphorina citri TaxID=116598 RepID=UPI00030E3581|nr:hypothetical protein [Wolbachia endosymbiont of Diaphorina citri]QJT94952.1 hypothetical protein HGO48_06490 [Wolbachia endosymbiont of Diaphorina citri]QJT96053.1 hypothetical protein HGO49_05635 [Wolbachia endosymbiont of Diaphorina citri]QJT97415.1 hypothetical protein HGO53_06345 [Wolbachia endosymbiont of Diaphorina citri]QLK11899.1 hypothetical protein FK497_06935 [Wolbachia endosymbiont of Diaphorina citri]QXY86756.1 hypothetical protein GZ064_01920 [Wolbachia endosymbiont of Diaphor
MLTNNNNTPSSAPPPPPPPPPADWGKNWKPAKNNDKNENTLGSTPSKTSNSTQLKRGLSEVSNPNLFEELKNNSKFKKANNASDKTADKGSKNSIHVKNPETRNSAQSKEEDNASDKTKNDRSNTKQVVPKKPMTGQHNGVQSDSENQKSSGLKYSIAILLLCTSGPVAGVYTYFIISAVLSSAAVPVSSAVIAFVSALVMLSLAAYLINSHISAINSEKGVDPGRKQSQDLQKAKGLEHSNSANTPTSSLPVMSGTPSAPPPPPPPPEKSNDLSTAQRVIRKNSPSDANQKDVQQKQSGIPLDDRSNLLEEIKKGTTLKQVSDEQKKNYLPEDGKQESNVQLRNTGAHQVRKVESQKTDKEPSNSESMQQMNSLAIAIQKQRGKSGFQNEQLDSLDENDHQEDSLFCLEEEQFKPASQEQKKCVQQPDAALSILKDKCMETKFLQPESPINNLSSNSGNVPDDEDWETQPYSMPYIHPREKMEDRHNHNCSASSPTKMNNVELASSDMQEPFTVSVKDCRKKFE